MREWLPSSKSLLFAVNFDHYIFHQIQVYLFLQFVRTHWETRIDINFFQTITYFIVVAAKKNCKNVVKVVVYLLIENTSAL